MLNKLGASGGALAKIWKLYSLFSISFLILEAEGIFLNINYLLFLLNQNLLFLIHLFGKKNYNLHRIQFYYFLTHKVIFGSQKMILVQGFYIFPS